MLQKDGVKSGAGLLALLLVLVLLSGQAEPGCLLQNTDKTLCLDTGGTWDDSSCPKSCWPPRCGEAVNKLCASVCGSKPVCICPSAAPYWDDQMGCLSPQQCPPDPGKACTSVATAFELEVWELTNQERAKLGLAPQACDVVAVKVARQHSQAMCDESFFSHTAPDGSTPLSRLKAAGLSFSACGENIAAGQPTPAAVVKAWMGSPAHKSNILSSSFTHLGVGHASCSVGTGPTWTQNFLAGVP